MDADAWADCIIGQSADPAALPDLHRLKLALITRAVVHFPSRREEIAAATGVALRTMREYMLQYRALQRREANEQRIVTSDGG